MIRKSVAVLSSALLTGAALVGFAAPAQAAGEIKLEADAGYNAMRQVQDLLVHLNMITKYIHHFEENSKQYFAGHHALFGFLTFRQQSG